MSTAVTLALLLFILATAIGTAQARFVSTLRAGTHQVKRWGGVILIGVGAWLIVLAVWAEAFADIFPV